MPISMKITPLKINRLLLEKRQDDVAKEAGISQQRYSQIERGEVVPNKSEREKLKAILGEVTDDKAA
jgi:transcriptional regulator with XRE-family HTH domain